MTAIPRLEPSGGRVQALIENVERVVFGKREAVTLAVVGLLAEGHLLLEDVPGTGKTTLARALARSVAARIRRIQFTSDLLPADVLGCSLPGRDADGAPTLEFQEGPIFGNVVLADELNRTTPRTQSALLEAMTESRVSVEGTTHVLPRPFLVVATQNPLEFEGTYPLPESQLDRFLLRIRLGYPDRDQERRILRERATAPGVEELEPVLTLDEVSDLIAATRAVRVEESIVGYILDLVEATRAGNRFLLGASPRASIALYRACQGLAVTEDRDYCLPDDVKRLFLPVLGHRVVPHSLSGTGTEAEEGLADVLEEVAVPS